MAWNDRNSVELPVGVFEAAQSALISRGLPEDSCGYCGCMRKHHLPEKYWTYSKTGASSGKSISIPTYAPTCCDKCPTCFCTCVAFVEPSPDIAPRSRCYYVDSIQRTIRKK